MTAAKEMWSNIALGLTSRPAATSLFRTKVDKSRTPLVELFLLHALNKRGAEMSEKLLKKNWSRS